VTDSRAAPAHTVTRRSAIGAGLAFASVAIASVACPVAVGAPAAPRRAGMRPIDALFVDETIELPGPVAGFIDASRHRVAVVGIRLDAASHAGLLRLLDASHAIAGVSCGATLFCLERIAWDRGLRLAGRSGRMACAPGCDALRGDVDALLGGARLAVDDTPGAVRAYRPSRVDGTLHAWLMHRPGREA
jgi:hypothetical protein